MDLYKLRYLPLAHRDLLEIDAYLSEVSPNKAKRFIEKLDSQCEALQKMPLMYAVYQDFPIYRAMLVMDYLVFYVVDQTEKRIDVHRIIYGGRDIPNQLP